MKIPEKMTRTIGKMKFGVKKHSPEILVVAGVAGIVASTIMACKATTKLSEIMEPAKKDIATIKDVTAHPEKLPEGKTYTKKDSQKDLTILYAHTGLQLVKMYAPSVILGALSITCIVSSNQILRKRNAALAAAYATVDSSFKNYRKNVVERFGEELDRELKYNLKAKEVEETVTDEKGNEKTVKKTVQVVDPNMPSDFARFFDNGSDNWQKDAEHNLWYLKQQQNYANEKLRANGYLFLNDVYDMLGIPRTKAGQIVGWLYRPEDPSYKGDSYVDFGIYDYTKEQNRDFVNGYERTILLDFNVDGPIYDLI